MTLDEGISLASPYAGLAEDRFGELGAAMYHDAWEWFRANGGTRATFHDWMDLVHCSVRNTIELRLSDAICTYQESGDVEA